MQAIIDFSVILCMKLLDSSICQNIVKYCVLEYKIKWFFIILSKYHEIVGYTFLWLICEVLLKWN